MNKNTAVLLAGGIGSRFDHKKLKTLHKVNKTQTLTDMVISDIKSTKLFNEIILVFNNKKADQFKKIIDFHKIKCVENGDTRFLSAVNGAKKSKNQKIVFIDVAAPFYKAPMLKKMIDSLKESDGVMTSVFDSRADNVYVKDGKVQKIFKRGEILRVKSYQGVNKNAWLDSVKKTSKEKVVSYSEMLSVLLENGKSVSNVIIDENPRKITTKEDLRFLK